MAALLFFLILFLALDVASVLGWITDTRDTDYSLRLPARRSRRRVSTALDG